MKKMFLVAAAIFTVGAAQISMANDDMKPKHGSMGNMMTKMDTNGDSMLSKDEFMRAHEQMFDRMKGQNGMVAMKDMPMNCMGMMKHGGMMGQGDQMPGGMGKGIK